MIFLSEVGTVVAFHNGASEMLNRKYKGEYDNNEKTLIKYAVSFICCFHSMLWCYMHIFCGRPG